MKRSLTKSMLLQTSCKENEIECLKQEVYQLKDLEYDIFKLNDQIAVIQAKYNMVLDEKDRSQVLLKTKMNLTKQNLQELQSDVQVMKSQISQANLDIQNIARDNATLQKSCDNKQNEILSLTVSIKEMERTNENKLMDLKSTEQALQRIKEHKSKMEDQCDKLCKRLNENKQAYKQLERQTKNQMIVQKSLNSTLENMRQEGESLLTEMKIRENVLKETSLQYDNLCQQVKQALQLNEKLNKQCKNSQDNYNRMTRNLELSQKSNEQKTGKLREIENCVFKHEQELSKTVIKRDSLMKEHSDLATKNKDLNLEIDDCLMKILQLENVNKALQKHIQEYIACDQQARYLLDRKQKMTELLQTVGTKLSKTESVIAHLM